MRELDEVVSDCWSRLWHRLSRISLTAPAPTPETTILTTYPIPPGSTPRGSVTDDQLPLETPYSPMSDPFSVPAVAERRSSEFSDMTRVNLPSAATSPVAARVRPLPTVPPSPEPPLCTLVVDDDK